MLMASTPFGVSAGRFTLFRVVFASPNSAFPQVTPFYAAGSIPGSSTEQNSSGAPHAQQRPEQQA
jgi:hypothetical protein